MIDIDSICMLYRRAHTDKHIIHIICAVHCLTVPQVREILITQKLMTVDGAYIAPVRLTGKETDMAQWKWMPQRKKLYDQLAAEGKTVEEIAAALGEGCSVEIIRKYANNLRRKPSLVTTRKVEPVPDPEQSAKPPLLFTLVQDAQELCLMAWGRYVEMDNTDFAYTLGRLQEKLDLAASLLDSEAPSS